MLALTPYELYVKWCAVRGTPPAPEETYGKVTGRIPGAKREPEVHMVWRGMNPMHPRHMPMYDLRFPTE